eukprot:scaffold209896_cov12-Tisochrysis_lutea.AAC.1
MSCRYDGKREPPSRCLPACLDVQGGEPCMLLSAGVCPGHCCCFLSPALLKLGLEVLLQNVRFQQCG